MDFFQRNLLFALILDDSTLPEKRCLLEQRKSAISEKISLPMTANQIAKITSVFRMDVMVYGVIENSFISFPCFLIR